MTNRVEMSHREKLVERCELCAIERFNDAIPTVGHYNCNSKVFSRSYTNRQVNIDHKHNAWLLRRGYDSHETLHPSLSTSSYDKTRISKDVRIVCHRTIQQRYPVGRTKIRTHFPGGVLIARKTLTTSITQEWLAWIGFPWNSPSIIIYFFLWQEHLEWWCHSPRLQWRVTFKIWCSNIGGYFLSA